MLRICSMDSLEIQFEFVLVMNEVSWAAAQLGMNSYTTNKLHKELETSYCAYNDIIPQHPTWNLIDHQTERTTGR